jgi:hypothetical protein
MSTCANDGIVESVFTYVLSERESAPLRMLSAQTTSRDVCGFTSDPHFFPTRTFFPLLYSTWLDAPLTTSYYI